ncbi:MAG TPA: GEVED domain-containing protein [Rhodanobacteraceae bacterium]|nr:GEVED domain-containing protein [Rhodanobacteraceae bacterium]
MLCNTLRHPTRSRPAAVLLGLLLALSALTPALAIRPQDAATAKPAKAGYIVQAPELEVLPSVGATQSLVNLAGTNAAVAAFTRRHPGEWLTTWDARSDRPNMISGAGIPIIPGRGNRLSRASLGLTANEPMDLATVGSLLEGFIKSEAELLKTTGLTFKVDPKSAQPFGPDKNHWFIDFQQVKDGVPVKGAHLFFRIAAGNIIQFGSYLVAPVKLDTKPDIDARQAFDQAFKAMAFPADTHIRDWLDQGTLGIYPYMPETGAAPGQAFRGKPGSGYAHRLLWRFAFHVDGDRTTYQVLVDAHTGALVDVRDLTMNVAAEVKGGVYPPGARNIAGTEVSVPFPFAAVTNNGSKVTDADGSYDYSGGAASTSLSGKYLRISDNCGNPALSSGGDGVLDLGTSGGTDCTKPSNGSSTHSARNAFYYLTGINRKAAGYYPSSAWLNGVVNANVNIDDVCNAYWDGVSLNFFKSGAAGSTQCANTGELSGVFMHEFGHGIQSNIGGDPTDMGTGEATGDTFAFLQTRDGCIGDGFFANSSAACAGVRDVAEFTVASNSSFVVKPSNITTAGGPDCDNGMACPYKTPQGYDYQGPMGYEGHCESYIASGANWDLAQALVGALGDEAGWQKMDDLWYAILPDNTAAYQVESGGKCNTSAVVNGCASNNWYNLYLAADDDDGSLANGTPNACRIWDAFNAHGIACGTRPTCSTAEPGFVLELEQNTIGVCAPGSNSLNISSIALGQPPLSTPISLAVTGLPAGVSASFSANPLQPGADSVLSFGVDNTVATAALSFTLTGQASGVDSKSVQGVLNVSNGAPAAPGLLTPANGASGVSPTVSLSWAPIAGATSYTLQVASDAAFTTLVEVHTGLTTTSLQLMLPADSTYYWRVLADNYCGGSGWSTVASFSTGSLAFPQPYCSAVYPNDVEPITRVLFAGIDNASPASGSGLPALEDFTAIVGTVSKGQRYPLSVEGNTFGNYTDTVAVFIDWNRNGSFSDGGERYALSDLVNSSGADGQQATTNLMVPTNAKLGKTRMRVSKLYREDAQACNTAGWGQSEDYTINVQGLPVAVVTPTQLDLVATVGTNASANLTVANVGEGSLHWSFGEAAAVQPQSSYLTGGTVPSQGAVSLGRVAGAAASVAGASRPLLSNDISQMVDNTPGDKGVSCGAGGSSTSDNSWWRRFYFGEYPAVPARSNVRTVTVSTGVTAIPGGMPVTINLYTIPHAVAVDTIPLDQLTLIGSYSTHLNGSLQSVEVPVFGHIDDTVGKDLVVELHTDGSSDGRFMPGANASAETHPTFMTSNECGVATPTTVANIGSGFPDFHMTMVVALDDSCSVPSDIPWLSVNPGAGTTVVGGSDVVTVSADASALAAGNYAAKLCMVTDDPAQPLVAVPVSFDVAAVGATYTVSASVTAGNGSVSPAGDTAVNPGDSVSFTLTPAPGNHLAAVGGSCGGSLSGDVYTTTPVTASCSVQAQFAPNTLVFTTQPADVPQGGSLGQVVVSQQDGQGNAVGNDSSSVVDFSLDLCGSPLILGSATMVNGVASLSSSQTFMELTSGYVIHASSSGALNASADSAPFAVLGNGEWLFANGFDGCRP